MGVENDWFINIVNSFNEFRNGLLWFVISSFVIPLVKGIFKFVYSRNRKYILLPIKDESNKDEALWVLGVWAEAYKFLLPMFIIWSMAYVLLFFVNAVNLTQETNILIYFEGMLILVFYAMLIKCDDWNSLGKEHFFMTLLLVDIYILLILARFGGRSETLLYVMMWVISLITYVGVDYCSLNEVLIKKYKRKGVCKCALGLKIVRTSLALLFLSFIWIDMLYGKQILYGKVVIGFCIIWFALCIIEWIVVEVMDKSSLIEVKVLLGDEIVVTKERIEQINENKIRLFWREDCERIVDSGMIKSIQYCLKKYRLKSATHKVVCIRNDGTSEEYQGCKYVSDKWVRFHRTFVDRCEITLVHDDVIKEIRCE